LSVLLLARPTTPLLGWLREQGEEVGHTLDPLDPAWLDRERFDALVSYGYPRILPAEVLERFPDRAVNLHISLLPWNRGSHPNLWSWVHETPKGVTVHHMDPGVDTGDIVDQREVALDPGGTLATTHEVLSAEMEALFRELWPAIRAGTAPRTPQAPGGSFHYQSEGDALMARLPLGWDTPVADVAGIQV